MLGYVLLKVMGRNTVEMSATTKDNKIKRLKKHLSKCIGDKMVNCDDANSIDALKVLGVKTEFTKEQWNGYMNKVQFS